MISCWSGKIQFDKTKKFGKKTKKKKTEKVLDIVSNLYIDQFEKYYDEYEQLFDAKHSLETSDLKIIKIDIFSIRKFRSWLKIRIRKQNARKWWSKT